MASWSSAPRISTPPSNAPSPPACPPPPTMPRERQRQRLARSGEASAAARACGVNRSSASGWVHAFRRRGAPALAARRRGRKPEPLTAAGIAKLDRQRMLGRGPVHLEGERLEVHDLPSPQQRVDRIVDRVGRIYEEPGRGGQRHRRKGEPRPDAGRHREQPGKPGWPSPWPRERRRVFHRDQFRQSASGRGGSWRAVASLRYWRASLRQGRRRTIRPAAGPRTATPARRAGDE